MKTNKLLVISVVVPFLALASCESESEAYDLYSAWKTVNPSYQTTFHQWKILRENKMLPGVDYARQAAEEAAAWSAAGAGIQAGSAGYR